MTTGQSQETINALTQQKLEAMELHLEATDKQVEALKKERDRALIWGIGALGTAIMGIATWAINFVSGHLK